MLGMPWSLTEIHGWGLLGVHTALYLIEQGRPPLLMQDPVLSTMRSHVREKIEPLVPACQRIKEALAANEGKVIQMNDVDMLHALGNRLDNPHRDWRGRKNIGVIAYEDTTFNEEILATADIYDRIVTHSRFNVQMLREAGVRDVRLAWQGVDPDEIAQMPERTGCYGDRFVVFSGGKLEYRKGQDIVLEAFNRFHQRHPDSVLITAWQNAWPATAGSIAAAPWCKAAPEIPTQGNRIDMVRWAVANGLEEDSFIDLGYLNRTQVMAALAESDVALFPNRCEGATNLVANEAMACGIPSVIAANTGQLDLMMEDDVCFPLLDQSPVDANHPGLRGWSHSNPEEVLEQLETIYTDRAEARRRAERASRWILENRTWRRFAEVFVLECES